MQVENIRTMKMSPTEGQPNSDKLLSGLASPDQNEKAKNETVEYVSSGSFDKSNLGGENANK